MWIIKDFEDPTKIYKCNVNDKFLFDCFLFCSSARKGLLFKYRNPNRAFCKLEKIADYYLHPKQFWSFQSFIIFGFEPIHQSILDWKCFLKHIGVLFYCKLCNGFVHCQNFSAYSSYFQQWNCQASIQLIRQGEGNLLSALRFLHFWHLISSIISTDIYLLTAANHHHNKIASVLGFTSHFRWSAAPSKPMNCFAPNSKTYHVRIGLN